MESMMYTQDSLLVTDDEIFKIKLYDEKAKEYEKGIAYLDNEFFYTYKGKITEEEMQSMARHSTPMEVGIYFNEDKKEFFLVEPRTDEEKDQFKFEGKISSIDPDRIIEMINTKEMILVPIPESSKLFIPVLKNDDDILKRLIKRALIAKNVDIDQHRDRFPNKNSLFNLKQVIKSDNTLSILLFDRACEALNLKYTITLEDSNKDSVVGDSLNQVLTSASTDSYEI